MSFLRQYEISVRWFFMASVSFVISAIIGFWVQDPIIPTSIVITALGAVALFIVALIKGVLWIVIEGDFRDFIGLKSDFSILPGNPDTMDYLRPIVERKMVELFNNIRAAKMRLKEAKSNEEFASLCELIRKERALYEKRRKLVRKIGFEVRSERKRFKSLQKQEREA